MIDWSVAGLATAIKGTIDRAFSDEVVVVSASLWKAIVDAGGGHAADIREAASKNGVTLVIGDRT